MCVGTADDSAGVEMLKNNMIRTWELMLTHCESVYRLYSRIFSSQQLSKRPKEVKSPSDLL